MMIEINKIYNMDCFESMKLLDDNSVDSIVTDPPYELGFMGKKWDNTGIAYNVDVWRECLRVLKPGGHLLAFGGTRTYHRMACAIEDAGFEIRDQMQWIYGSGFPKSQNISKAIDKKFGAKREVIKTVKGMGKQNPEWNGTAKGRKENYYKPEYQLTASATPEAKQWDGWGTALKPANEPICVARKPISEKTVAENVLKWGTGGINIDDCRIETDELKNKIWNNGSQRVSTGGSPTGSKEFHYSNGCVTGNSIGRFPANVILDEEAGKLLDEQSGTLKSGLLKAGHPYGLGDGQNVYGKLTGYTKQDTHGDSGGASRFFYCAKASKKERNMGLEDVEPMTVDDGRNKPIDNPFLRGKTLRQNTHPTVKPVKLMEYLITLITPPNGIVLDPFMGSGTTAIACINTNHNFIGFELDPDYYKIAEERIRKAKLDKLLEVKENA